MIFPNLVIYHIYHTEPLPPNDALAYQYVLAGNGLFVRAETCFFRAVLPVAPAVVRGLPLLAAQFQLRVPRLPARLRVGVFGYWESLPVTLAHSPGELHIALSRLWQILWANVTDEIARAQGKGQPGGYFGLPVVEVEDLTGAVSVPANGIRLPVNGRAAANCRSVGSGLVDAASAASTGSRSQ